MVDIQDWLKEICVRGDNKKRMFFYYCQFEVVKLIAECICHGMDALDTDDYESFLEPLRRSTHGSSGTGETHVIQRVTEE